MGFPAFGGESDPKTPNNVDKGDRLGMPPGPAYDPLTT